MQSSGLPYRWRLPLLILVVLGVVLIVWQTAKLAGDRAMNSLKEEAENELRLSTAGLEGHLSRHDYLPQLIASREDIERFLANPRIGDAMSVNLLLDSFRSTTDVSDIYLLDRQGITIAASNWHRDDTFLGQNYAFRPYYQDAIAGQPGRFYGLGVRSLDRGYYFSAPVRLDDGDNRPDGVMVVKVPLDQIESSWAEQSAELLVTDKDDIIFMASQPQLRLNALHPLSDEMRETLLATRRYADEPLPHSGLEILENHDTDSLLVRFSQGSLSDQDFLRLSRSLPDFDWQMHILKSLAPVHNAQWQSGLLAGGLYGMVILGGGFGWQRLRLRREREQFAERERQTLAQARDELERHVENRTRDLLESNRRLSDEIDERRRAEANLRQTQDELIQAAKLAVLGQLAAGINHELNQPIAAIRAYAENAQAFLERGRAEAATTNLDQIIELTARMAEISTQLKQFSRKSGEQLTEVSVPACFDYALRLFQARISEAGVDVVHDMPTEGTWVRADPVRLEQVFVNLIGNALQAMADNETPCLKLGVRHDDDDVYISVVDNGPGIDEDSLARIFEPFFTTKSPGNGLGLGLSISSRIIDDLGGRLDADNVSAGGARFLIVLPRAPQPDRTARDTEETTYHG